MAAEGVVFILGIGILAVSALVFSTLFARLGLSIIPGQILAGMVVGPSMLGLVNDTTILNEISTVGIVLLLFIIGLELDPVELSRLARKVTLFTSIEVGVAFGFGLVASYALQLSFVQAMILSMASSLTSTAIVGKGILERKSLQTTGARYIIGLLIIEDIVAVVFLILLSSIASSNQGILELISPGTVSGTTAKGILAIFEVILGGLALIGSGYFVARYIAPPVINYLSTFEDEFEEISFLFALGLGFLFAVLAAYLGYSPGIGAFIIGLSIRGKQSKFLASKIAPIKDLFLVLFFVSMGSLIDPLPSLEIGVPIVVALVLLILGKFSGGYLIGFLIGYRDDAARQESLTKPKVLGSRLIPRGEFSLVIGQLGLSVGLIDNQFFSVIGLSVLITALAATILQRFTEPKRASSIHPFRGMQDDREGLL
ncbi:MAG: cation:proton antiporter [Nitrososphaerales archaeon]